MTTFPKIKGNMEALGIYKPEFDITIKIYVGLIRQYNALEKQLKQSNYDVTEKTGYSDNAKKSPLITTMESLRKDILQYSNQLGLTPTGLRKLTEMKAQPQSQPSVLEQAMMQLAKDD